MLFFAPVRPRRRELAPLSAEEQRRHKLRNRLQSVLLLGGMALLVAVCGWILFGPVGLLGVIVVAVVTLMFGSRLSAQMVLRMYKAERLSPAQLPDVFRIIGHLTKRAGLEKMPALYYVPSAMMNAFAVGRRDDAVIGVTDGLLRTLNLRELTGVLAHEMSHIRNNDVWLMGMADLATRLTRMMSLVGAGLLFLSLPMWLQGGSLVSFVLILLLMFAPQLTTLLQLALSRAREFDADLDAAGLTGDPDGLASPRTIALALNKEGVAGPSGKDWGPSTINGNRQRGTGILNNELYIGRLVWNRLRYVKDPDTGKRISRLNPEAKWITQEVPELRIIDQDLWDKVKARQATLEASTSGKPAPGYWDRRRPKYLFSGLMKCSECGGGAVIWNQVRIGCANARNKGTCANKHTIRRDALEAAVLDGLQHHLMDPELTEVFCKEYTAHMNRLRKEHVASEAGARTELQKITREIDRLIQAICDGVPGNQVKDRMTELEAHKTELTIRLDGMETPPPLLHPNMADYYRQQVTKLRDALNDEAHRTEAADILRTLIDRIELRPVTTKGQKTLAIDLHGELAGILSLASKQKGSIGKDMATECTKMVAGERKHREHTFLRIAI